MGYEWEEAAEDKTTAEGGIAALGIGLLGLAIGSAVKYTKNQNREAIKRDISIKQSRIHDLKAKWFPSTAQQQELARLEREVEELKKRYSIS